MVALRTPLFLFFEKGVAALAHYKPNTRTDSVVSSLVKFSLPLILSGILQQLYNWADAFIVGNVDGDLALAAVGATTTVINFYVNAITGFTVGLSILFAQKFGGKEYSELPNLLSTFTLFLGSVFLILAIFGFAFTPTLLKLLHTTEDTITLAESYLKIICIGFPFLAVYNVYAAALRGIGDSKSPFYAVLISSVVNVGLDIFFVADLKLGVVGAGAATVLSQAAMTIFLVTYGLAKHAALRHRGSRVLFDPTLFRQGCQFSLPPCLQSSISSAGNIVLQRFMNGFGTATVTAITTAYRIDTIVMLPITNLGSGISTLVAQRYGSNDKNAAKKVFLAGSGIMSAVSIFLTVLVIPTGGYLIALFGAGAEAVAIGSNFFMRIACFYLLFGLATSVRGYLEGIGDVTYSGVAWVISLAFRIIASYSLALPFGNMVIAYAEAFSWVVLLLLYLLRLAGKQKRRML